MNRKLTRRAPWPEPEQTPVVVTHVIVRVTEAGALDVTVDGAPYPPPQEGGTWTRSTFGALLDAITAGRTSAVRVEVQESDGSAFTDIIRARRRTTPAPPKIDPEGHRGTRSTK